MSVKKIQNQSTKSKKSKPFQKKKTSNSSPSNQTFKAHSTNLFAEKLEIKKEQVKQQFIEQTIKTIETIGNRLSHYPTTEDYQKYKETITLFFQKLIPSAYAISKSRSMVNPQTMRRKEFILIKEVNEELASLLKMIHQKQASNLNILSKTTTIKGLLINLLK